MFVDASAAIGIVAHESDRGDLNQRLSKARRVITSPIAIYESVTGLARSRKVPLPDADESIAVFLKMVGARTVPVDVRISKLALEAFARYGKGRHKANLNMGDCFAYACAKAHKVPLLYKGRDFALTDIERA